MFGFEDRIVNVGCVTSIVPSNTTAGCEYTGRQRGGILIRNVSNIIEHMDAPVAHLTIARVERPVPIVLQ